jgi:small Trp-rich protein
MPLVIVGLLFLSAKYFEFGPFAHWPWWLVLLPFGLAVLWWHFADTSGMTARSAMDRMEKRKLERRDKAMEALGMGTRKERAKTAYRATKARSVEVDPKRAGPSGEPPSADPTKRDPRV